MALAFGVGGWLTEAVPLETMQDWVMGSVERARTVARIAETGRSSPSPLTRWLLLDFGDDDETKAHLAARFFRGSWTGPYSAHLTGLIAQLDGWAGEPEAVRSWASEVRDRLEERRESAIRSEAEQDF